jgi:transposase-like protein/IS1 family transposase
MNCKQCDGPTKKFGKDRDGNQRFRCSACKVTFTEPHEKKPRLVGNMILTEKKIVACLQHLVEGCSVRSTERLTGVHRDTILRLLETAGKKCDTVMNERIKNLRVSEVECDEQWQYIGMKQKTRNRKGINDESIGDSWVFTAFERNSKLILAWHLGHRTESDTIIFTDKLAHATTGRFQVTTDGFKPYQHAIVLSLGVQRVDFAQLVKLYTNTPEGPQTRYSPAECTGCKKVPIYGNPDMERVSTSHVERHNLSTRMSSRRYTRLRNAFSKSWIKHYAALSLWYAYYNFCRVHRTLRVTPAMEAGITDHIWSLSELLAA